MLSRKSKSILDVAGVLKIYRDNVDDNVSSTVEEGEARAASQKEILEALIAFIEGL